jgi:hypothetical protein
MKKATEIRMDMENFVYGLEKWIDQALDNDNVSDTTYDFVRKMYEESKQELHDLSVDIIAGQYDEEEQVSGPYLEAMNVLPEKEEVYGSIYYINHRNDEESIWHLSYSIKKGQKTIIQNCHYYSVFNPETMTAKQIHDKLIDMLHDIEESEREDIDPDDSFDTIIRFVDPDDDQDPTPAPEPENTTPKFVKNTSDKDFNQYLHILNFGDHYALQLCGTHESFEIFKPEQVKEMISLYRTYCTMYDLTEDDTFDKTEFDSLCKEADTFDVYEGYMDDLRKKVTSIRKKAEKYGCDFIYEEVGETMKEVYTGEDNPITGEPINVMCKFIKVYAKGTARINDWEFVASVEHTSAGNIFSKAMTDLQIPARYRTAPCTCEHCNTNRIRKDTFIIHNTKTNEFKQIGKSCLRDYSNGMSASGAVFFASLKEIFKKEEDRPISFGGFGMKYFDTVTVLDFCAEVIRKFGYTKGSETQMSTKGQMLECWDFLHGNTRFWNPSDRDRVRDNLIRIKFDPKSEEAHQMTLDALEWIRNQEATNDYLWNLKTVCNLECVNSGRFGLLLSLFPTYNRDLEKQDQLKKERVSKHLGLIGDRITVKVESVRCLASWETQFGSASLYKIVDVDGNVLTWKTSVYIDPDRLPETITGTVKDHDEYKGVQQTVLTRCKMKF